MNNLEIRNAMDEKGLKQYEVAHELGISHITFCSWLRYELPEEKKKHILSVIDLISRNRQFA